MGEVLKGVLQAPVRSVALIFSVLLLALAAVAHVAIGDVAFGVQEPIVRALIAAVALGLMATALFAPQLRTPDPQSSDVSTDPAMQQAVPTTTPPPQGQRTDTRRGLYRWEQFEELEFARLLASAQRLTISARTAVNILSRNASEITRFLERGGMLRLLTLDPAEAGLLKIYAEPTAKLADNLRTGLRYANDLRCRFPGHVAIRLTDRPPTYGLVWIDALESGKPITAQSASVLQVKIYLEHSRTGAGRPNVLVLAQDEPWHQVFVDDFNAAWQCGKPLDQLEA